MHTFSLASLSTLAAMGSLVIQPADAQSIDSCLLGTWRATSISDLGGRATGGGTGFQVTFRPDGTQIIDYASMAPFIMSNPISGLTDTQRYTGTAAALISTKEGVAKIEKIEQAHVLLTISTLSLTPALPLKGQLGPGGLGTTKSDNGYVCNEDSLEYKTSAAGGAHPTHSVKLTRAKDSASAASPPAPPPIVVKGKTWLTATEINDRPQDIEGLWAEPMSEGETQLTWLGTSPPGTLTDHPLDLRDSDPASIDMKAMADLEWQGRVFTCPRPKGKCTNLCKWNDGSLRIDANHLSISGEWHGKKFKNDCSGFWDEPDSGTFRMKRLVGVSFVPLAPGKYMNLVGAPAVGTQAAQFKAVVRISARYDVPNSSVRATADQAKITLVDKDAGTYEFYAEKSGVYEVRFELLDSDVTVFHTDRMRIEVPSIPGLGR
jgi:hypothetical protein